MRARGGILLGILLALGCKDKTAPTPAPEGSVAAAPATREIKVDPSVVKAGRVAIATVEQRGPRADVQVPGEVRAGEGGEAKVTSLVSGRVASLDALAGQAVKRGQVLGAVESPEVGRAQAEWLRAESRATLADRALARQLELEKESATSAAAIDQARAEAAAARADSLAARTALASFGVAPARPGEGDVLGSRVALRSPIDGVVVERTAVLGGPVTAGTTLFWVVAPGARTVLAKVPETLASRVDLAEGAPARVRPRGGGLDCAGTIEKNYRVVDESRAVPLRVRLTGACEGVAVGGYVEVSLRAVGGQDAGEPSLLLAPEGAVVDLRGTPVVFVASAAEGAFEVRSVARGRTLGADVEILSGLRAGERVCVNGAFLLKGEALRTGAAP